VEEEEENGTKEGWGGKGGREVGTGLSEGGIGRRSREPPFSFTAMTAFRDSPSLPSLPFSPPTLAPGKPAPFRSSCRLQTARKRPTVRRAVKTNPPTPQAVADQAKALRQSAGFPPTSPSPRPSFPPSHRISGVWGKASIMAPPSTGPRDCPKAHTVVQTLATTSSTVSARHPQVCWKCP